MTKHFRAEHFVILTNFDRIVVSKSIFIELGRIFNIERFVGYTINHIPLRNYNLE